MTIQTDLRNVTDSIIAARKTLADREFTRMAFARNARQAKAALDVAMVTSMARSEAGPNETTRRAFATYETTAERRAVKAADDALTEAEAAVLDATVTLRSLEDERRYLETIVRLAIANLDNLTVIDDSDYDDGGRDNNGEQGDEDNLGYNRDVADARRAAAREEDFTAYIRDLRLWREKYEQTLAGNRWRLAELQEKCNVAFGRYEVAFVAVTPDDDEEDDEPYVFKAWAADNQPDMHHYWDVYDNGRVVKRQLMRVLWVGERIIESVIEAGRGPWRKSIWVEEAGQWLHTLAGDKGMSFRARHSVWFSSLPEEPSVTDYGEVFADGLTADEYRRINEVIGDMERAGIPF